jgi:predicted transcriptional regulator
MTPQQQLKETIEAINDIHKMLNGREPNDLVRALLQSLNEKKKNIMQIMYASNL